VNYWSLEFGKNWGSGEVLSARLLRSFDASFDCVWILFCGWQFTNSVAAARHEDLSVGISHLLQNDFLSQVSIIDVSEEFK
jgi:hypothetical protein